MSYVRGSIAAAKVLKEKKRPNIIFWSSAGVACTLLDRLGPGPLVVVQTCSLSVVDVDVVASHLPTTPQLNNLGRCCHDLHGIMQVIFDLHLHSSCMQKMVPNDSQSALVGRLQS